MTELITNKNYSEAERLLHIVDKRMLDLIGGYGRDRHQIRFMDIICRVVRSCAQHATTMSAMLVFF